MFSLLDVFSFPTHMEHTVSHSMVASPSWYVVSTIHFLRMNKTTMCAPSPSLLEFIWPFTDPLIVIKCVVKTKDQGTSLTRGARGQGK